MVAAPPVTEDGIDEVETVAFPLGEEEPTAIEAELEADEVVVAVAPALEPDVDGADEEELVEAGAAADDGDDDATDDGVDEEGAEVEVAVVEAGTAVAAQAQTASAED